MPLKPATKKDETLALETKDLGQAHRASARYLRMSNYDTVLGQFGAMRIFRMPPNSIP